MIKIRNDYTFKKLSSLSKKELNVIETEYKNEFPKRRLSNTGAFTKNFLNWVNDKKIFKPQYHQTTFNLLPCLKSYLCTSGNDSEDVRKIITNFIETHFDRLLEIKCNINEPKVISLNIGFDTVKTMDAFKDLGFCCSRSELLRFIMFYEFLKRGDDD